MTQKKTKHDLDHKKLKLEYSFEQGVDFDNRIIRLTGTIGTSSGPFDMEDTFCNFDILDAALTEMEKSSEDPIIVRINSGGGSVYEALAMVGRIKASSCKIITEAYGHCMSAATLLLACGDERKVSKYCISMFHQSSYGIQGSHEEIKEEVAQMEREEKLWAKWISELSTKDERFWKNKVKKKNMYLTAEEMLSWGVVDAII